MKKDDVQVLDGGRRVSCRVFARSAEQATELYLYTDANPPEGYYLTFVKISKRPRGGRARMVSLFFTLTDGRNSVPMTDPQEWIDTLDAEVAIGAARKS